MPNCTLPGIITEAHIAAARQAKALIDRAHIVSHDLDWPARNAAIRAAEAEAIALIAAAGGTAHGTDTAAAMVKFGKLRCTSTAGLNAALGTWLHRAT